jgi:hypothetical protein
MPFAVPCQSLPLNRTLNRNWLKNGHRSAAGINRTPDAKLRCAKRMASESAIQTIFMFYAWLELLLSSRCFGQGHTAGRDLESTS